MHKNIKKQAGFSSVETLLIVVIVAIIGFVGWFVYDANNKASNTIDKGNQGLSSTQGATLKSTKTTTAAGTRAKNVAVILDSYIKANPKATYASYVDKHINDGQFTKSFKTAVESGSALAAGTVNPVYCSSGSSPSKITVKSSTLSGDIATVVLNPTISGSTTAATTLPQVTLNFVNSTWSVDNYSCVAAS